MRRCVSIRVNEKFIDIYTRSGGLVPDRDPLGEDIYLELSTDIITLGKSTLKALKKSRDLTISEEDQQALMEGKVDHKWIYEKYPDNLLFIMDARIKRYNEWEKETMKKYRYKTKKAFYNNMQYVAINDNGETISFTSLYHYKKNEKGKEEPEIKLRISSDSNVKIVGAATKYAIGNCRGMGADYIRDLLFPEGQPATFEDYLEQLNLSSL